MLPTKAEAAAIAYSAIHGQIGELMSYENKLRFMNDVIEILKNMAETEYSQYVGSTPHEEVGVVD